MHIETLDRMGADETLIGMVKHGLGLPSGNQPKRQRRTRLCSLRIMGNQRMGSWVNDGQQEESNLILGPVRDL